MTPWHGGATNRLKSMTHPHCDIETQSENLPNNSQVHSKYYQMPYSYQALHVIHMSADTKKSSVYWELWFPCSKTDLEKKTCPEHHFNMHNNVRQRFYLLQLSDKNFNRKGWIQI